MSLKQASGPGHHKPEILVVDDQRVLADLFALILNENGFSAHAVYSGSAALGASREVVPEIVVSDIDMPGLDGVRTAIGIKRRDPLCGVILVSGMEPDRVEDSLRTAQAEGYAFEVMPKPVNPRDLIARIDHLLGKRRECRIAGDDPCQQSL